MQRYTLNRKFAAPIDVLQRDSGHEDSLVRVPRRVKSQLGLIAVTLVPRAGFEPTIFRLQGSFFYRRANRLKFQAETLPGEQLSGLKATGCSQGCGLSVAPERGRDGTVEVQDIAKGAERLARRMRLSFPRSMFTGRRP